MFTKTIMQFPTEKVHRSLMVYLNKSEFNQSVDVVTFVDTGMNRELLGIMDSDDFISCLGMLMTVDEAKVSFEGEDSFTLEMAIEYKTCEVKCIITKPERITNSTFFMPFNDIRTLKNFLIDVYDELLKSKLTETNEGVYEEPIHTPLLSFDGKLDIEFIRLENKRGNVIRFLDTEINSIWGVITPEMLIWFLVRFFSNNKSVVYAFPHVSAAIRAFEAKMHVEDSNVLVLTIVLTEYRIKFDSEEHLIARINQLHKDIIILNTRKRK